MAITQNPIARCFTTMREMTKEEMAKAERQIQAMVSAAVGKSLTQRTIDRLGGILDDTRTRYRLRGLDLPKLTVCVLPSIGQIYIYRADTSNRDIENIVVNMTRLHPAVEMMEIAKAVHRAFPHYKPANLH